MNIQDCIEYHQAHRLALPSPDASRSTIWANITHGVVAHLSECCRFNFDLIIPLLADYQIILSIYDSHTIEYTELEDSEEEDVIRILREELDVFKQQNPRWFFSS